MQGPPTPSGRILRAQLQGHCKAMPIPKVGPISFARDMVAVEPPLKLTGRWRGPKDGLYRVATRCRVYGGYLVHRGRVTRCSPAHSHLGASSAVLGRPVFHRAMRLANLAIEGFHDLSLTRKTVRRHSKAAEQANEKAFRCEPTISWRRLLNLKPKSPMCRQARGR